jgi:hypothetical protein
MSDIIIDIFGELIWQGVLWPIMRGIGRLIRFAFRGVAYGIVSVLGRKQ